MSRKSYQRGLWLVIVLVYLTGNRVVAGALTGRVTDATGQIGLTNAVVWAEPMGAIPQFPPPKQHAAMAQVNLAFVPRILPILVGTTVDFPNRDTVYHSVFSFSRRQRFEIGLYPPGQSRAVTFDKVGLVKVFCNIHDQMFGAILVLPTPYFSISVANGRFTIPGIPAGDYTVHAWHERFREYSQAVSLTEGATTLTFSLPRRGHRRK